MSEGKVQVFRTADLEWSSVGGGAVRQKTVRNDPQSGEFLGLMSIAPLTRTGLHKHLDVAFAFHLAGSSTNFSTVVRPGQLGITLNGTLHETVIYEQALSVVRTEGQTMYPRSAGDAHVHSGAVHGDMTVDDPQFCGCLAIEPATIAPQTTAVAGITRRVLFDYAGTGKRSRVLEFVALPGSETPRHRASARLEAFVIAGDLSVNGAQAGATDFVCIDAGTTLSWSSAYGCRMLLWADGPAAWLGETSAPDLYALD